MQRRGLYEQFQWLASARHPSREGYRAWTTDSRSIGAASLHGLGSGSHTKDFSAALAEELLKHCNDKLHIDRRDIYHHLLDYWAGTMQDECYLIAQAEKRGWKAKTTLIVETGKEGKEKDKG